MTNGLNGLFSLADINLTNKFLKLILAEFVFYDYLAILYPNDGSAIFYKSS